MNNLPPEGATPGRVRWRILAILVVLSLIAYVLRMSLSVAGDSMMRDLGISQVQLGMAFAAFAWAYALAQFPGGVLGDVLGPRRVLTWIAVCWTVVSVATGLIPGGRGEGINLALTCLIALQALVGLVQAPLFPTMAGSIRAWFPTGGWAYPTGLTSGGLTLGAAATSPLIAWLVVSFGWRLAFILTAPLGLLAALLWWRTSRDDPAEHPDVGAAELAFINRGREPTHEEPPGAWKLVLRDRNVLLLTLSYFCMNYVFYMFFHWFFIYLVQVREFQALEGGFLATAPWIVGAFGAIAGGAWCDRVCKSRGMRVGTRQPALICLPLVAVLLWAGAGAPDPYKAVVMLSLCFGCTQLTEGAYWAAMTAVAGRHTSAAAGVLNTGGNAVGGFGALLVPILAEHFGWIVALSSGSVMALIAAILWLFIRADEPLEVPRRPSVA